MTRSIMTHPTRRPPSPQPAAARRFAAFDWVIPGVAVVGLGMAGLAAMGAGGEAAPRAAGVMQAAIVPVAIPSDRAAIPGAPRIAARLDSVSGAIERCDAVSGRCRALPVEDTVFRMTDGSEWMARTAFDDRGQVAYTLWYDDTGALVATPPGP